jgi:hypothetical protein
MGTLYLTYKQYKLKEQKFQQHKKIIVGLNPLLPRHDVGMSLTPARRNLRLANIDDGNIYGGPCAARTRDSLLKRQILYQLS